MTDIMNNYTINVTQDDIDHGQRGECAHCPIALAAQRVFPNKYVMVALVQMYLDSSVDVLDGERIHLPEEATAFITAFDRCQPVSPFVFTVDVPSA
jgi:hypothetical protein